MTRADDDGRTLVLFDIDGTLLHVKGAGRRSFIAGLQRAWGVHDALHDVNFSGATDLGVLAQLRTRLHLPDAHTPAFFVHMADALHAFVQAEPAEACVGAVDVVTALRADPRVVLGVVTGNARATAHVKLASIGVHDAFTLGAYGDEHADRNVLASMAVERARALHDVTRVILLGDTPSDVAAARAVGAVAIAVATGSHDVAALTRTGADPVVATLADPRVHAAMVR
jgi:phosphoglycolate phosphatase-like HAD superfamily hydrolase